jgi:hypothetical protein
MIGVLHFILDSYWNTFATLLALAVFRPIRVSIRRESPEKE